MKASIDRYVNRNYQKLVCIAQKMCGQFKRPYDGETIVTGCYLMLIDKPPKREEDIERHFIQLIKTQIMFPNSRMNKDFISKAIEPLELKNLCNSDHIIIEALVDWNNSYSEFMNSLDYQEQIVCDVYFRKGKRTIRELAEHFDIATSSLFYEIQDVLKKIKEFENESKERIRTLND